MKTILKKSFMLAGVGALLLAATSCDDYLSTPPVDRLSSEGFYATPQQAEQGVLGVYAGLRDMANEEFWYLSECRSDNMWAEPQPNGLREYSELAMFRADYTLPVINNVWNKWYKVIYNANIALVKIPNTSFDSEAMREQFLGEMYFLRAWAHFELVRLFGNVPMVNAPLTPEEANALPQSTAREVYEGLIIPDLKEAIAKLPAADNMVNNKGTSISGDGRADQWAAKAMLARVYMTMGGYPVNDNASVALAKTALKEVIDYADASGKYWAPDSTEWQKQFTPDYNNKYSIFAIQFRSTPSGVGNPAIFNMSPGLPITFTNRRIFGNSIWIEKTLMKEFARDYDGRTDARGYGISILTGYKAVLPDYKEDYNNPMEKLDLSDPNSTEEVLGRTMFYKFLPSYVKTDYLGMADVNINGDYDWPVNLPILRYEDILLMYAELLTSDDVAGAMAIVNRIRERAGCDPETASGSAEALELVKRERRVELVGEGVHWFDLVRWNEWKQATLSKFKRYNNPEGTAVGNVADGRYLYPIPMSQMDAIPGLYTQNEGYNN